MENKKLDDKVVEEKLRIKVAHQVGMIFDRIADTFNKDKDVKFFVIGDKVRQTGNPEDVCLEICVEDIPMGQIGLNYVNVNDNSDCPGIYNPDTKKGFYCTAYSGRVGCFDDKESNKPIQTCPLVKKCEKVKRFLGNYEQKYLEKSKWER